MGRLLSGAGLEAGSPLLELRNLLIGGKEYIEPRDRTILALSALYCAWNNMPGRAFMKLEHSSAALVWFRQSQAKRFAAVEKLFHQGSQS
jgi:hypothetical protein